MIQLKRMSKNDRIQRAHNHVEFMNKYYANEIEQSINYSQIYDFNSVTNFANLHGATDTKIKVVDADTVTALFDLYKETGDRIAVLNFASYKNPGGMFYEGSSAQEEFLCHHSTLYPVLSTFEAAYYGENRKNLNMALYTDKALYSMFINFFDFDYSHALGYDEMIEADVITCAAPNVGTYKKYYGGNNESIILDTLRRRCHTVLLTAASNKTKSIILGAFGCGVFKNDPVDVATIFKELLQTTYHGVFKTVVFAIPNSSDGNYNAFKTIFRDIEGE